MNEAEKEIDRWAWHEVIVNHFDRIDALLLGSGQTYRTMTAALVKSSEMSLFKKTGQFIGYLTIAGGDYESAYAFHINALKYPELNPKYLKGAFDVGPHIFRRRSFLVVDLHGTEKWRGVFNLTDVDLLITFLVGHYFMYLDGEP